MQKLIYIIVIVIMLSLGGKIASGEPISVQADQLEASVYYDFVSQSGDILRIRVQYEAATPTAEIHEVQFAPLEPKPDGEYVYNHLTSDSQKIIFTFVVKNYRLLWAQVETDYKPQSNVGEEQKVLSLKSRGGYVMLFTFSFNNGQYTGANIKPKINPFS